jgi:LacI family transcriptional regulator
MQKNVVVLLRTGSETGRNMLAGILKRIKDSDRCAIRIAGNADYFSKASASASALIANVNAPVDTVRKALADGKPVVLLNDWRFKEHPDNLGHIRTDDGEIGFRAADYFLSIGKFRSFGYVPAPVGREWSAKRGRAFAHRLRRKGHDCRTFDAGESADGDLGAWLRDLPKPAAVFCAWDCTAADVAYAAKKAKIRIPSQMVLLGVDNDEAYCTSSSPQISSIEFDAEREGAMAADLALKMLSPHRRTATERIVCCGAVKRIVERESTRPPAPAAVLIERAMKFIAENAARGISPQDVADSLGVSRTLLDLRFRETGNATVGRQILEKRLTLLSAMLRKSKVPVSRMTRECGFGSVNYAKAVFRKRFGMSMREFATFKFTQKRNRNTHGTTALQ